MQQRHIAEDTPQKFDVAGETTTPPSTERRLRGRLWSARVLTVVACCVCVVAVASFGLFWAPLGIDVGQRPPFASVQCPTPATTAPPRDAAALKAAGMMAPIMALPLRCNARNMRPLTPRPCHYDANRAELIVGILSLDNKGHGELRQVQRDTWFRYKDVARASNGFSGRMFVEYVLGAAFENNFTFSEALYRESREHGNILVMDVKERKRVVKKLLTTGRYGAAAEFTMTVKVLAYYCYAEQTYTQARFIAKADDDEFIRVPVVMRTLEALPSYGVAWSTPYGWGDFCGTSGIWIGLSRDTVHLINSLRVIQDYGALEMTGNGVRHANGTVTTYQWLQANTLYRSEDNMPGLALTHATVRTNLTRELGLQYPFRFYAEHRCRIHNQENDKRIKVISYFPNPFSMVIHHAHSHQQARYWSLYPDNDGYNVTFRESNERLCFNRPVLITGRCSQREAKIALLQPSD